MSTGFKPYVLSEKVEINNQRYPMIIGRERTSSIRKARGVK
jgi:hypothetical protein